MNTHNQLQFYNSYNVNGPCDIKIHPAALIDGNDFKEFIFQVDSRRCCSLDSKNQALIKK